MKREVLIRFYVVISVKLCAHLGEEPAVVGCSTELSVVPSNSNVCFSGLKVNK